MFHRHYAPDDLPDCAYEFIPNEVDEYDEILYSALVIWRDEYAREHHIDVAYVATDAHLKRVARDRPTDEEGLTEVGFDEARLQCVGSFLTAHVAAQYTDWRGVRTAPAEQDPHAYQVYGEDQDKHGVEELLTEIDDLDKKL